MTLRLSTELRDQLMGKQITLTASDIAAANADNSFNGDAGAFLTTGFRPGMVIYITGFTGAATTSNVYHHITSVSADGAKMIVTTPVAIVDDAKGEEVVITAEAQSLKDILAHGVMCIYTGSQPADADTAPTGTKLLEISKASGAFGKGFITNSLIFDAPSSGVLGKADADTWSDAGLASGTAGWFRFYANDFDTGTDALCFDGAVATSGAELNLSSTAIVAAATTTIDEFEITMPAAA